MASMVTIIFESHGTTFDNENGVSSGWFDARLSPQGAEEAKALGRKYADDQFDAVFCSDLKRAHQTATIAFDFDPKLIFSDWRLRECNYGQYTQVARQEVGDQKLLHIQEPFIDGESYSQVADRVASFLNDLKAGWSGKRVMIIGHGGTWACLELLLNNKPLEQSLSEQAERPTGVQYQIP